MDQSKALVVAVARKHSKDRKFRGPIICEVHELSVSEILGETTSEGSLLMPFTSHATVFPSLELEKISFLLATRLGDSIWAYDTMF